MQHIYCQKRYGHVPRMLPRELFIAELVAQEGLPKWAAESLTSLAESRCTLLLRFEEDRTFARSRINEEFYVRACEEVETSPQRSLQLENLEGRK